MISKEDFFVNEDDSIVTFIVKLFNKYVIFL